MTGIFYLDWPIITISLFNAILSLWLALTVLLNTERRDWGVAHVGGGLLTSAVFFICHTAIVGGLIDPSGQGLEFWWHAGWLPIILAPFGWYALMLWYSGFWERPNAAQPVNSLRRRQTPWLILTILALAILIGLAIFTIPSFAQAISLDFSATPHLGSIPLLLLLYPLFIVACIALALDALLRPGPSHRVLGGLARQRSRPWLVAASLVLLAVSLLVSAAILWGIANIIQGRPIALTRDFIDAVAWFDLAASALIAIAIALMGQAIVSYEVFTGTTLPRRGFLRNWRGAVALAAGYSLLAAATIAAHLQPIYGLVLGAVLMTAFYSLFNWRAFVERDQFIRGLRPFVSSQGWFGQRAAGEALTQGRAWAMFSTLCADILGAARARLIPLGAIAPLVGQVFTYPAGNTPEVDLKQVDRLFTSPDELLVTLPPDRYAPFRWAIPLWTERGLVGALLLANKQDGGLYAQEEIAIARATAEGILDTLAGEELARRLVQLQRRRLAETAVMDRRARRVLHDDVLPGLHTALLAISALRRDQAGVQGAVETLTQAHRQVADLIHDVASAPPAPRTARDLPEAIRNMLATEFKDEFDSIRYEVSGAARPLDELAEEVVFFAAREAVRNAALHAPDGSRPLSLTVTLSFDTNVTLIVEDDGVGMGNSRAEAVETPPPGSGGGLALHSTMLAVIGGTLTVEPGQSGGAKVTITAPTG